MNYNVSKVPHWEAQKDKFEDDWRKRESNAHPLIKRLEQMKETIGKKVDPEWVKKKKRKGNKRVHKIALPTKKLPENMSMKSLNRIKIKKDEVFKQINREQHHMTWGFKSIEEINRLIQEEKTMNQAGNEHTSSTSMNSKPINEAEENKEEANEVPFEIDPKIFESSEESIVSSEQKITNEVITKKEEPKQDLIQEIMKRLKADIENFRASIVPHDPAFEEQNKTLNKIIIVLSKLRNGFEKASFNKKYSNEKTIEKEETKSDTKGVDDNNTTGGKSTDNKKKKKKRESLPSYKKSNYIRLCINNALIKDIPIDFQELYDTFNCAG